MVGCLKMSALELESDDQNNDSMEDLDQDTCDEAEINRLFPNCDMITETVVAKNKYILHIDATSINTPSIAVALSDYTCALYELGNNQVAKVTSFAEHTDKIVDCRFSNTNHNLLYTGTGDGFIKLWDLRTPKKAAINFTDTSEENPDEKKRISCFDLSFDDKFLIGGTELYQGDAFIMFWDTRSTKLLGAYWEGHTDDITQVKYLKNDQNILLSGSTDGLINVYHLSESTESDALSDCLNTESSIEKLLWFEENGKDNISCITHTEDLQLWNVDGAEPYKNIRREDVAKEIKKETEEYIYLVNTHRTRNSLLVLAGSNFHDGECLRGVNIRNGELEPAVGFNENKQRVRCSWYNENTNVLLTGGEKGILNAWKYECSNDSFAPAKRKKKN